MTDSGIIKRLSVEFASALLPLANSLESKEDLHNFIKEIGWDLPASAESIGIEPDVISDVLSALERVHDMEHQATTETVTSNYFTLALSLARLVAHIKDIPSRISTHLDESFLAVSNIVNETPKRIIDYLLIEHVKISYEWLYQIFITLGIFELQEFPQDIATFTSEHTRRMSPLMIVLNIFL